MRVFLKLALLSVCILTFMECGSTWPTKIRNPRERFKILDDWNREVIRDNETGLLWERVVRTPGSNPDGVTGRIQTMTWSEAVHYCYKQTLGNPNDDGTDGRAGWRLPAIEELTSLFQGDYDQEESDIVGLILTSTGFNLNLPRNPDFPDRNSPRTYWSITSDPSNSANAFVIQWIGRSPAGNGVESLLFRVSSLPKSSRALPWCVRGGVGHDPYRP